MTRVAIYVRQSQDHQEGIERQLTRTRALALSRSWTVSAEYEDNAASASKVRGAKSAWGRMLKDAEDGQFTHVIAVDLDRLIRSQRDMLTLLDLGLKIVTVDGEIDLTTADGEFRATMLTALARFEVARKGERQKRANIARVAAGRPVPGRRRYGYEPDNVTPREEEAVIVRRAFAHILSGGTVYGLAKELNAEGVPRANSKVVRWEPRRVRDLINVVAYGGQVQHQGVVTEGTAITPLVSREDAEAARAILADPSRRTSPGNVAKHLLSNIAICGECGGPLVMMRGYRCGNTNGNHVFIRKDVADSIVIEEIGWRFLTQGTPHDTAHESNTIRKLLSESAELSTRRTQVTELAMMPGIDMARIRRELSEIDALSLEVGESIARERGQLASADLAAEVKRMWAEAQADNGDEAGWPEFWASLGIERQREILRTSFRITIHSARKYPKSPSRDVERLVVEPLS